MPKEPGGSGGKEGLLRKGASHPLYLGLVSPCKMGWLLVWPNKTGGSYSDCQWVKQIRPCFWLPLITPTTVGPKKGVNNSTFPTGGKTWFLWRSSPDIRGHLFFSTGSTFWLPPCVAGGRVLIISCRRAHVMVDHILFDSFCWLEDALMLNCAHS